MVAAPKWRPRTGSVKRVVSPSKPPWKQAIYLWVGIALIPIGILLGPLPGPTGIPIIAFGMLLIVMSSRRAASWVRLHRRRWDWMHEILEKGEGWLGGEMGRVLRRTNGRRNQAPRPPVSRRQRVLDIMLFPVHIALILARAVARRFGWGTAKDHAPARVGHKRHRGHGTRRKHPAHRRPAPEPADGANG
jgi:hypothetical protein